MKFLSLYTPDKKRAGAPTCNEEMAEMGKLIEESTKSGMLLSTGGLMPGLRVRSSGGKVTVIDGPFTEAKEVIAGFAVLEAKSDEEAIELTKRFLKIAGDGETELRRIMESADFPNS
jgi:hypothetical protein